MNDIVMNKINKAIKNKYIIEGSVKDSIINLYSESEINEKLIDNMSPYYSLRVRKVKKKDMKLYYLDSFSEKKLIEGIKPKMIKLHCESFGLKYELKTNNNKVFYYIFDKKRNFKYIILSEEELVFIGNNSKEESENEMLRILRGAFEMLMKQKNFVKLHFASLICNGVNLLIAGKKGGGKTTFLTRLLETKYKNTYFVSNDKSLVGIEKGKLKSIGLPIRVGIQPGTLRNFKELIKYSSYSYNGKNYFWMKEFASFFNKEIRKDNLPQLIVIPNLNLNKSDIEIRELSYESKLEILKKEILRFNDKVDPNYIFSLMQRKDEMLEINSIIVKELIKLKWIEVEGNPHLKTNIKEILNKISEYTYL